MNTNVLAISEIDAILRRNLPGSQHHRVEELAKIIADIINSTYQNNHSKINPGNNLVEETLRILAGHQVTATDSIISFGENSNTGDIAVQDAVAGNKYTFNLSLSVPETPVIRNESNSINTGRRKRTKRVKIFLQGDFNSLSEERKLATIDTIAALLKISPKDIELYNITQGSIILEIGLPDTAVKYLEQLLRTQPHLAVGIGITKVIIEHDQGEEIEISLEAFLSDQDDIIQDEVSSPQVGQGQPHLTLDEVGYRAILDGKPINLTMQEYSLLKYLYRRSGQTTTAKEISEAVWGQYVARADEARIQTMIHRLRRRLSEADPAMHLLRTVPGKGYVLVLKEKP